MIKIGFALIKIVVGLIVGSFVIVASLFTSLGKPSKKVRTTNKGKWWDYDRNTIDNDIEQISRTDKFN